MAFIEWNEELNVHVPEIDAQHRRLVTIINRLHEAMSVGGGRDRFLAVLDHLGLCFRGQFAFEEKLLKQINHLGLADHARSHYAMMMHLDAFRGEIAIGHISAAAKLLNFLKTWLVRHILFTDAEYRRHMTSIPCTGLSSRSAEDLRI